MVRKICGRCQVGAKSRSILTKQVQYPPCWLLSFAQLTSGRCSLEMSSAGSDTACVICMLLPGCCRDVEDSHMGRLVKGLISNWPSDC